MDTNMSDTSPDKSEKDSITYNNLEKLARKSSDSAVSSKKYYRSMHQRIFVNRSLSLEKIKFFGFDMDYTIAEYKSPDYESLIFNLSLNKLISMGYPAILSDFEYDPLFPIRGLWFDKIYGNFLKVDPFGNILVCVHGFQFLTTSEIYNIYPNKFVQIEENRISILNVLFDKPYIYLLACVIDYFSNSPDFIRTNTGVTHKNSNLVLSYKSIWQDIREALDWVHDCGALRDSTLRNPGKYLSKDERLPLLFDRMKNNNKKIFLLTNSGYEYTNKIMTFLFDVPTTNGRSWTSFFDYIVVDARKPLFFGEGTILRQVDIKTGALHIGTVTGPFQQGQVYSGGSCDVFTQFIGAKGRDVLYVGDHIYGDILKSKKQRGWRTFLIVPELTRELHVWTNKKDLFDKLQEYDIQLGDTYKDLDSGSTDKPDLTILKTKIRETIHELDMSYGILGSILRCGSRQTHFANQITRYADLYASSFLNLMYYPFSYMFTSPAMLMPHESTVAHETIDLKIKAANGYQSQSTRRVEKVQHQTSVPHLYPEKPVEVTHHHDTDDEDRSNESN